MSRNKDPFIKGGGAFFSVMFFLYKELERMGIPPNKLYDFCTDETRLLKIMPTIAKMFAHGSADWYKYSCIYDFPNRKAMFERLGFDEWDTDSPKVPIEEDFLLMSSESNSKIRTEAVLFNIKDLEDEIKNREVLELIKLWGLEPANLTQTLYFYFTFPEVTFECLVGLNAIYKGKDTKVVHLMKGDGKIVLESTSFDGIRFGLNTKFLAVKPFSKK